MVSDTGILQLSAIKASGTARDQEGAIREAGGLLVEHGAVTEQYIDAMFQREQTVSTYMGNLLAIPHGTNEAKEAILHSGLSVVRYDQDIDWAGNPVRFVIGIAGVNNEHLDILSKIAIIFSEEEAVQRLLQAKDAEALLALLSEVNE